jgi:hypothetical protein
MDRLEAAATWDSKTLRGVFAQMEGVTPVDREIICLRLQGYSRPVASD